MGALSDTANDNQVYGGMKRRHHFFWRLTFRVVSERVGFLPASAGALHEEEAFGLWILRLVLRPIPETVEWSGIEQGVVGASFTLFSLESAVCVLSVSCFR